MIPETVRKQLGPMVHAEEYDIDNLGDMTDSLAEAKDNCEGKIPVAVQAYGYGPGYILGIHMDDLPRFIRAYLGAHYPAKRLVRVRTREDAEGKLPQLSHGTPDSFDF